jgi:hypothetical protein
MQKVFRLWVRKPVWFSVYRLGLNEERHMTYLLTQTGILTLALTST